MAVELPPLYLRRREERRVLQGHPWIYSNEVDVERSPLTSLSPGQQVQVLSHAGRSLGVACANPHALICARLFSRDPDARLDAQMLRARLARALRLRERLFERPFYRLVYGEGDALPGLVVDRYDDVLVAQLGTAGMEQLRETLCEALLAMPGVRSLVLRNDTPARALEQLPAYVETLGAASDGLRVEENGAVFELPATEGQKTGWFYDHRPGRARVASLARGASVLDLFSYAGGFGIEAALAGAREVLCVDGSAPALDMLRDNASRNGVAERVQTLHGDVFTQLRNLRDAGRRFDIAVIDPPAFIRRRKDMQSGQEAYRRVNRLAFTVLADEGLVFSASCSSHLRRERLLELVAAAAGRVGRELVVLAQGHQGADHPVHPALPESDYLKAFLCRVNA